MLTAGDVMIKQWQAIMCTGKSSKFGAGRRIPVGSAGWIAGALIVAMMVFAHDASAASAPTFQAAGTAQSGTGALTGATAVAWPTHQTDDIGLLIIQTNNQAVSLGTNAANWTQVTNSPQGTGTAGTAGATRLTVFWSRATSSSMGAVGVNDSGDHQLAQIITFRGVSNFGNPWDVTAGSVAAASTNVSIPGATTTVANTLVVAIVANGVDTSTGQINSSWVNANLSSLTQRSNINVTAGNGGGFGVATGVKATAGAYGATTTTLATSSAQGLMSIALRPPQQTTLGDGTNPSNTTIAPSLATPTDVDAFTLQTTDGSDTVTAARVTLTGCNAPGCYVGITLVQITDNSNNVKGSVTDPTSDIIDITLTTNISVSTTTTTYKVRITPKTHANMPVPPGDTYPVAATITSFTSSANNHSGTDTASAVVTIDNKSPGNVTSASATPGAGLVTVQWTNPADPDGDFSNLVVLRNTASITNDVPLEGSAPAVDSFVGTSVVRHITSATLFTDTGLTGGQQYFYRIFAKDTHGNYSATGVEVSATPTAGVTVGQVSNNGNASQSSLSWSHTTSGTNRVLLVGVSWVGSQTVSSVTYAGTTMTSIGSVSNSSNARAQLFYLVGPASGTNTVLVTMSAAATEIVGGAVTFTGANQTTPVGLFASATGNSSTPSVTVTSNTGETVIDTLEVHSSTAMTAGGGQTQRWQMQPSSFRGAGSTEAGASTVTMSWTSGSAAWAIGAVGVKPAATCSSVSDATYVTANTQGTQATVYWSSSNPVLILRKTAAFGTEAPASGASYNVNETIGAATVVFKGAGGETFLNQTGLNPGTTYYYKVFPKTSLPCYAPGIAVSVTPAGTAPPAWSYATGAASMAPPALDPWSNLVVTGSNDNNLHGTADSDGSLAFAPFATNGPIQARPAMLPAAYRTPSIAVNIAYVTSQDGNVYAVNTSTGLQVWKTNSPLGTTLQGGANVWIQALAPLSICGVTTADVVFVATSNTGNTTNNKVYALNGSGGNVTSSNTGAPNCTNGTVVPGGILWTFSPAAQISVNMDVVSSTPYVDFGNNAVWVTSRAAGGTGQPSVWKINAQTGALFSPGTNTWTFKDIDSSPTPNATGSFIFVGTNGVVGVNPGTLRAIRVSDGTVFTHTPLSGTGSVNGMPWPLWYNAVGTGPGETIIFTLSTTVHSVNFDGTTFTANANWPKTLNGTPTLSAPVDDGANHLYIGGSDGKVHQIDADTGNNEKTVPATAISGTMGDPTFNVDLNAGLNRIHVGGSDGHIYTFTTPF